MSALRRWLVSAFVLLVGRGRRPARVQRAERIVPLEPPSPRAELLVLALFGAASTCAVGFVVVYAVESIPHQTQFLGLSLGLAFAFLAAALVLIAYRLVVTEELEEDYPPPAHPAEQEALEQLVEESGDRMTRKRLLLLGGGAAGAAIGAALITPALSLGPIFEVAPFYRTPWRPGVRLVDERGRPLRADEILEETFYTAYPEGADREELGSPLVVVRLQPAELHLPPGRDGWAPDGIVAYSKICTHAACAIALYRKPTFPAVEERPALVCPCHYSTFDPARGGKVLFGPAGRPLPQLPLEVRSGGELRAGGNFSGPIGPSWWGVRNRSAS
ncbi:MAG TPA: Rieske 2Fe-2S domain-containing protein [Gaiellaceae bacterium]|nr:Rieske 2Fe-2S domain-containing protein [Gaiellaceae bacterium]